MGVRQGSGAQWPERSTFPQALLLVLPSINIQSPEAFLVENPFPDPNSHEIHDHA